MIKIHSKKTADMTMYLFYLDKAKDDGQFKNTTKLHHQPENWRLG